LINYLNLTRAVINYKNISLDLTKILKRIENYYPNSKCGEINLCFCSKNRIKNLNKDFMNSEKVTDVLSFPDIEYKEKKGIKEFPLKIINGDIAICITRIIEDAQKDKENKNTYLIKIILHGILHLFGMEHTYEQKSLEGIWEIQNNLIKNLILKGKYLNV